MAEAKSGDWIVFGNHKGKVVIYNLDKKQIIHQFETPEGCKAVIFRLIESYSRY